MNKLTDLGDHVGEEEHELIYPLGEKSGNLLKVIQTPRSPTRHFHPNATLYVPIVNLRTWIKRQQVTGKRLFLADSVIAMIAQASGSRPYPNGQANTWHDWCHSLRQLYLFCV